MNDTANRLNAAGGLANFPELYPNAGVVDPRYYAHQVMEDLDPVFWDGTSINLPPVFAWGGRIGARAAEPAVSRLAEHQPDAGHGGQLDQGQGTPHPEGRLLQQPQLQGAEHRRRRLANLSFQGYVNFGNDTNNPIDSGFGYANAALGVFSQYLQAERLIEGSMIYNNTEFYVQDNWKASNRLTIDYGIRFTRQQPQHDQFQQMSNFFPDQWNAAQAPIMYGAACVMSGTTVRS